MLQPDRFDDGSLEEVAALVLSGGADVAPSRFGEPLPEELRTLVEVDEARDAMEWTILERAERDGLPVLAICRGVQFVNAYAGGSLHLDLPWAGFTSVLHRQPDRRHDAVHEVRVAEAGHLREVVESATLGVNSTHHQGIRDVAPSLRAVAWSEDGLVEALESLDRRILGVQWHPEALYETSGAARSLFTELVSRAAAHA